jgi:thiol:disulfide interchange protein DsbD
MKKLWRLAFLALSVIGFNDIAQAQGQIADPITWKFSQTQLNDSEYVLNLQATIQKGWHLYSQHLDPSAIQNPTALTYAPSADYALDSGTAEDGKLMVVHDTVPKEIESFYENTVTFKQKIKVHNAKGFKVKGNVYYQTCNMGSCLPPKQVDFVIDIPATGNTSTSTAGGGYLKILLLGFLGGLAALFTPCVFPMIPLTVSFFTKRGKDRKKGVRSAISYGLCIIFLYVVLGEIITAILGPSGMNIIASNGWVNLTFFIIFIVFGCSFLGAFELTLPSSWLNKADSASDKGGFFGIFFMALTLCLVSFSCTAPIVGSLLAGAAVNGSYWSLVVGMFGFSLALAMPFALFALFPSWMNGLPQSGGWLNSVKVVLGLLEIAFSLKFLSTADLVGLHIKWMHFHINGPMGILKREIFIALWIIIYAMIGLYLIGKIKFHHDSEHKYVSVPKLLLAIIAFSFTLYLIPGMFGAPLKLIGGFPPPDYYSEGWSLGAVAAGGGNNNSSASTDGQAKKKGDNCPLNLSCYHNFNDALAAAKQQNKPILIDFTGYSCVNCRKMESTVWADAKVLPIIRDDYVLASLYVDETNELPDSLQTTSKITGKKLETWGDKWSAMETELYQSNTQPLYVLVDPNGKELASPIGYTPDVDQYVQFLNQGKKAVHP